ESRQPDDQELLECQESHPERLEEPGLRGGGAYDQAGDPVGCRPVLSGEKVAVAVSLLKLDGRQKGARLPPDRRQLFHVRDRVQNQYASASQDANIIVESVFRVAERQLFGPIE